MNGWSQASSSRLDSTAESCAELPVWKLAVLTRALRPRAAYRVGDMDLSILELETATDSAQPEEVPSLERDGRCGRVDPVEPDGRCAGGGLC